MAPGNKKDRSGGIKKAFEGLRNEANLLGDKRLMLKVYGLELDFLEAAGDAGGKVEGGTILDQFGKPYGLN